MPEDLPKIDTFHYAENRQYEDLVRSAVDLAGGFHRQAEELEHFLETHDKDSERVEEYVFDAIRLQKETLNTINSAQNVYENIEEWFIEDQRVFSQLSAYEYLSSSNEFEREPFYTQEELGELNKNLGYAIGMFQEANQTLESL